MSVEGLLFLEQEDIGRNWDAANSLAVSWIGPRNTIVVGVVRCVVNLFVASSDTSDLGRCDCWALV